MKISECLIDRDMSLEDYHNEGKGQPDRAMGSSGAKLILKSEALYKHDYIDNSDDFEEKPHMTLGTAMHLYLFERDKFNESYNVAPEGLRRHKGRNDWKEFIEESATLGATPLTHEEFMAVEDSARAIYSHPIAQNIFKSGIPEESHFSPYIRLVFTDDVRVMDKSDTVMLKARPDFRIINDDEHIIVDFKSTSADMTIQGYTRHFLNMGGHIQTAHHKAVVEMTTGRHVDHVLHVVQSQKKPHLIRVFRIPQNWLEYGAQEVDIAVRKLEECIKTGIFPGYPPDIVDLDDVPPWAEYTAR